MKQPVGKGETNLARHIDDMHGFVKRRAGESESAEKNIVGKKDWANCGATKRRSQQGPILWSGCTSAQHSRVSGSLG